jgi:hypothetical protein
MELSNRDLCKATLDPVDKVYVMGARRGTKVHLRR